MENKSILKGLIATSVLTLTMTAALASPANLPTIKQIPKAHKLSANEKAYINKISKEYGFKKQRLTYLLKHAEYMPSVIKAISSPFEKKPWSFYRNYFVSKKRINGGVKYWRQHASTLKRVAKKYGVDPSVIVAIIGIESFYGQHIGKFQAIGALATLAFYYPPRSKFFTKELTQYLILTRREKLPALTLTSSYAGALGIPQFMPSSYRHYGVKFNNENQVNLLGDHKDAIASVANYLRTEGWRPGQPIATPAINKKPIKKAWIQPRSYPRTTVAALEAKGIYPKAKIAKNMKAALTVLHNKKGDEYWVTFQNFRAIMNYNRSQNYAMAVFQLATAIKTNYQKVMKQNAQ